MKVRYTSDEHGCIGEVNEVVLFVPEPTNSEEAMESLISSFGCSGCVDFEPVSEDTPHTREAKYDEKWQCYLLD